MSNRVTGGLGVVVVIVVAASLLWWRAPESSPDPPDPVDVAAQGPDVDGVGELVAATDLVVVGTVLSAGPGRAITDPADPTAGIRTELLDVDMEQVLRGERPDRLIIEQEVSLLDGTPLTVDGRAPVPVGERGVYFLVAGTDPSEPYHALVGPQGRYRLTGDRLEAIDDGRVAAALDGLTIDEVADRIGS